MAVCAVSCSAKDPALDNALTEAARTYSLAQTEVGGLRLYVDVSGSMRGYALAATQNRAGAGDVLQSVLAGLEAVPGTLSSKAGRNVGEAEAIGFEAYRFAARVEPEPFKGSVLSLLTGQTEPSPLALGSSSHLPPSADCGGSAWSGHNRAFIDAAMAQPTTCLTEVFRDIDTGAAPGKAFVILTDAEQVASGGECGGADNHLVIQDVLRRWTMQRNAFAALVVIRAPYSAWRSTATRDKYCSCTSRNLFLYLLTPSADVAEVSFQSIARTWHAGADAIAYLPLTPRPASKYELELAVLEEGGKRRAIVPTALTKQQLEPAIGELPRFWIQMKSDEAWIRLSLKQAAFTRADEVAPSFAPPAWSPEYTWSDATRLAFRAKQIPGSPARGTTASPTPGGKAALADQQLVPHAGGGSLELIKTDLPEGTESMDVRVAKFHALRSDPRPADVLKDLSSVVFRLKRTSPGPGTEVFALQLSGDWRGTAAKRLQGLPLLRDAQNPCVGAEAVRSHISYSLGAAPVVRALLRVDY